MNISTRLARYKSFFLLGGILFLAAFLLAYRLSSLMMFIGDFAWFYLSAKDMILSGVIPLSGIPSSHPWLHQGPLWTYLLAIGLVVSKFNPISGAVIAIIFGLFSVFLLYLLSRELFDERVAIVSSLLYATSPLILIHARMPYHTAPIPFFTLLLFYGIVRFVKGQQVFLPVIFFSLAMLYNLELATIIYIPMVMVILGYGYLRHKQWMKVTKRLVLFSLLASLIPMLPILIYDVQHGYPQTVRFAMWMGYKVLTLFGYPSLHPDIASDSLVSVMIFFLEHLQKLIFLPSGILAIILFLASLVFLVRRLVMQLQMKHHHPAEILLGLFLVFGIGGFFLSKTRSEAYLPMLFPQAILSLGLFFASGISRPYLRFFTVPLLMLIVIGNISVLLSANYLMAVPRGGYGPTYEKRLSVAKSIVKAAGQNSYTIQGSGAGSQFASYTMSTEYLTWYLSKCSLKQGKQIRFTVQEDPTTIRIINTTYAH